MASVVDNHARRAVQTDDEGSRRVVAGHYTVDLDAPLGQGGMALVYRGRDLRTRRDVALKTLRIEYRHDPETRARFRLEARTMAFLKHPNVARVFDLYEDSDAPWAVMEYIPGESLKDLVQAHGPFPLPEIANILDQVASALAHLHAKDLVHLDVKPQNILLTAEGVVKLIDFGLAQRAGYPQELIGGSAFGTAAYLAPEQAGGEPVDVCTDVYSLGCVVYELLTGRPPFQPSGGQEFKHEIIRAHLEQAPEPPSRVNLDLPAWVDSVVLWSLAKSPADRYHDVESFADVFRAGVVRMVDLAEDSEAALTSPLTVAAPALTTSATFPSRASVSRRAASSFYQAGGKVARRTGSVRRVLWRATVACALANALLALVMLARDGAVPGIGAGAELGPGANAQVVTEGLRIRAAPGVHSLQIGLAGSGDRLEITGEVEMIDDEPWWPVSFQAEGETVDGYAWGGGMKVEDDGLVGIFGDGVDRLAEVPGGTKDRLRDWLP